MNNIKTEQEIEIIKEGGIKLAAILEVLKKEAKSGMSTKELDVLAEKLIIESGGKPSFKGYKGSKNSPPYPATICVSVNDEVVHGIPTDYKLKDGDIVGLDIGMIYKNFYTDMAETIGVGEISEEDKKLLRVTKEALDLAISMTRPGIKTGDLGEALQKFIESHGFGVVRELVGHGVGYAVHEEPQIPNWGRAGEGDTILENMVIAIEPMVTAGDYALELASDGWTYKTKDGSRAAHFEHTIVVTSDGVDILTKL